MKVVQWTIGVLGGMILTALFVGVVQGEFQYSIRTLSHDKSNNKSISGLQR